MDSATDKEEVALLVVECQSIWHQLMKTTTKQQHPLCCSPWHVKVLWAVAAASDGFLAGGDIQVHLDSPSLLLPSAN